jgi:hypothetical protein
MLEVRSRPDSESFQLNALAKQLRPHWFKLDAGGSCFIILHNDKSEIENSECDI